MATIKEISNLVGVSIATVSKVLNNQAGVSVETQRAVLAAAKKLNYRPNLNARHLKTGTSRTLGIIAEDLTVFNTPDIIDGIGVCCESRSTLYSGICDSISGTDMKSVTTKPNPHWLRRWSNRCSASK